MSYLGETPNYGRRWVPAYFVRGGTSKGLFFRSDDLPEDPGERDMVFAAAIGSPDPHGRQLDGMGGGLSSLSKVMVVSRSDREDADPEYLLVPVEGDHVDYTANYVKLSAAVAPFAVDVGMLTVDDGDVAVRLYNVNTDKVIRASFAVRGGAAVVDGGTSILGVAGTGAPVRLDYLASGGAVTGRLLPAGDVLTTLEVGARRLRCPASMRPTRWCSSLLVPRP